MAQSAAAPSVHSGAHRRHWGSVSGVHAAMLARCLHGLCYAHACMACMRCAARMSEVEVSDAASEIRFSCGFGRFEFCMTFVVRGSLALFMIRFV